MAHHLHVIHVLLRRDNGCQLAQYPWDVARDRTVSQQLLLSCIPVLGGGQARCRSGGFLCQLPAYCLLLSLAIPAASSSGMMAEVISMTTEWMC